MGTIVAVGAATRGIAVGCRVGRVTVGGGGGVEATDAGRGGAGAGVAVGGTACWGCGELVRGGLVDRRVATVGAAVGRFELAGELNSGTGDRAPARTMAATVASGVGWGIAVPETSRTRARPHPVRSISVVIAATMADLCAVEVHRFGASEWHGQERRRLWGTVRSIRRQQP